MSCIRITLVLNFPCNSSFKMIPSGAGNDIISNSNLCQYQLKMTNFWGKKPTSILHSWYQVEGFDYQLTEMAENKVKSNHKINENVKKIVTNAKYDKKNIVYLTFVFSWKVRGYIQIAGFYYKTIVYDQITEQNNRVFNRHWYLALQLFPSPLRKAAFSTFIVCLICDSLKFIYG